MESKRREGNGYEEAMEKSPSKVITDFWLRVVYRLAIRKEVNDEKKNKVREVGKEKKNPTTQRVVERKRRYQRGFTFSVVLFRVL